MNEKDRYIYIKWNVSIHAEICQTYSIVLIVEDPYIIFFCNCCEEGSKSI